MAVWQDTVTSTDEIEDPNDTAIAPEWRGLKLGFITIKCTKKHRTSNRVDLNGTLDTLLGHLKAGNVVPKATSSLPSWIKVRGCFYATEQAAERFNCSRHSFPLTLQLVPMPAYL